MESRIDGKNISQQLLTNELLARVEKLKVNSNITPRLVVIVIGNDPASASYIKNKQTFAEKAGIRAETIALQEDITEQELLSTIDSLNDDASVHGIIVQLPIPPSINVKAIINRILPEKDVDGFTKVNVGHITQGDNEGLPCCTPAGIMRIFTTEEIPLKGKKVVVLGRSNIVGKPVALMCINAGATVTVCNSKTPNIKQELEHADIIIIAVGKPQFITADIIPEGCIIIDVGIHRLEDGTLCGDAHQSAYTKSARYTPVPGGVGPMTVFSLIANTITAAEQQNGLL